MSRWTKVLVLAVALTACGTGDDTADGTRALCAEGGALNECDRSITTPEAACWRMVDCGAIALHHDEPYRFDWDRCVDEIVSAGEAQARLMIACVAAASCDQLKLSENGQRACFLYGDN